jgi:hypothetical protein
MWDEPLTAEPITINHHHFDTIVTAGDGRAVARVRCSVDARTRCGYFGEMNITDNDGAPRQRLRALVLLTRESLRHAQELGITRVRTDAPPRLADFARRLTGIDGEQRGATVRFVGDLAAIRSRTLDVTRDDGSDAEETIVDGR